MRECAEQLVVIWARSQNSTLRTSNTAPLGLCFYGIQKLNAAISVRNLAGLRLAVNYLDTINESCPGHQPVPWTKLRKAVEETPANSLDNPAFTEHPLRWSRLYGADDFGHNEVRLQAVVSLSHPHDLLPTTEHNTQATQYP